MSTLPDVMGLLSLLGRQTLVLGVAVPLLLVLRRPLLRRCGAATAYAAWALLPLFMAAALLPGSAAARALKAEVVARLEPMLGAGTAPPEATQALWPLLLAMAWLGGALFCLLRLARLQRRYMQDLTPAGPHWRAPEGSSPALAGLLRPRLVLPADFEQRYDAGQRRLVLAHEDVHHERHDNLWNALGALLCVLHWFNPLAWLALRRMRSDQELACDAAVMARHPGHEATYARALLRSQVDVHLGPAGLPWAGWPSTHPLIERIEMLQHHGGSTAGRAFGLALLGLLAVLGVGTVHALQAEPPPAPARIELRMEIALTQPGMATLRSSPSVRVHPGTPSLVMIKGSPDRPGAEQIAIEVSAETIDDGKVRLSAEIRRGDPLVTVSRPRLVARDGTQARIEVRREGTSGTELLSLAVTPTVLGTAAGP